MINCSGLLHVSDRFYDFMLQIEQARVNHLQIVHCKEFGDKFLIPIKENLLRDKEFNLEQNFSKQSLASNESSGAEILKWL